MPGKFLSAVVGAALLGTIGTANASVVLTDSLLDTVTAGVNDTNTATTDVTLTATQSNSNTSNSTQTSDNAATSGSGTATAASNQTNIVALVNAVRQRVSVNQH